MLELSNKVQNLSRGSKCWQDVFKALLDTWYEAGDVQVLYIKFLDIG